MVACEVAASFDIFFMQYLNKFIFTLQVEQLHKIFKLCGSPSEDYWRKSKLPHSPVFKPIQPYRRRIAETFKDLPDAAVGLMEILLSIDPSDRGTASSALKSEVLSLSLSLLESNNG